MDLKDKTTILNGVGPALAETLAKCGIESIQDLLFHLPYRYQDRTRLTSIRDLNDHDWAVVEGSVTKQYEKYGKKRQLICVIQDFENLLHLRFFNYNHGFKDTLAPGNTVRVFGQVRYFNGHLEMIHPEFQSLTDGFTAKMEETLTPIYRTTQGLGQKKLRQLIEQSLKLATTELCDLIPKSYLQLHQLPPLHQCLLLLHNPPPDTPIQLIEQGMHPCQQRLALEELIGYHFGFKAIRKRTEQKKALPFMPEKKLKQSLLEALPFKPTNAQQKAIEDIEQDLQQTHPMCRLLQGDVGSGKTLVAAFSCLPCLAQMQQVAIMAPTELLAEQLHRNLDNWLSPLGFSTCLLVGKKTNKQKKMILEEIAHGHINIIVGTHALFQDSVVFKHLGLIIVDEQHRFGVKQRLALQEKGIQGDCWPHQLFMTATPIPRTLAMLQYATIYLSILDELPPGRTPIKTAVLDGDKRSNIITRLDHAFKEKKQAYWVCTLIEESDVLQCQTAEETFKILQTQLPSHRIGLVHGRMKSAEKQATMQAFLAHDLDLLVATTVIEVGVDVPNASLMIIDNAERLGLSQLHQLRGRVGRGAQQSHCVLLYQPPLSQPSQQRLKILRDSTDGFVIAEEDLKLRGMGEIIGTKQTGALSMKIANMGLHHHLLPTVAKLALEIEKKAPETIPLLVRRWLGDGEKYAQS